MDKQRIITVNLPEKDSIESRALAIVSTADSLIIDSADMNAIAGDELRNSKSAWKALEESRTAHVKPLNEEVKFINDFFRPALAHLADAESTIKRKMLVYQDEQEVLRRAEQARLDAIAKAERDRIAAEQAEIARKAFEEAEVARKAAEAEQKRLKAIADEAARAGNAAAAKAAQEAAERARISAEEEAQRKAAEAQAESQAMAVVAQVITVPVVAQAATVTGISTRATFKAECTDLLALVKFIAVNTQYVNLVKANDTAINQMAKAQQAAMKVDGVRVYEEKSIAARRVA